MPPAAALDSDAVAKPELILSGTYGWYPKRRDVMAFATDYAPLPHRYPIFADGLPPDAQTMLSTQPMPEADTKSIRFGVITDRFEAGHKLKTTSLIANNAIVLSFSDVIHDFDEIPDAAFFIRRIHGVEEIQKHIAEVMAVAPAELRDRLTRFKAACVVQFSWNASTATLLETARKLMRRPVTEQIPRDDTPLDELALSTPKGLEI